MTNNIKTPVMVLQELTVKRAMQSPEYSIIHARQGTHDNEFHYQVIAANVSAVGIGRSKQVAKHDAARKALDMLEAMGIYRPGETVVKAPRSEVPNSPVKLSVNAIGNLAEVCVENKIPMPTFVEISDVGPPHCKEFTYQCQIVSLVTRATAGTKKQAKQLAAKEMVERIMYVLPELVAECSAENSNLQAITENDSIAVERYADLRKLTRPKPNLALKVEDYDLHIKNVMKEKNVTFEDLTVFFDDQQNEETLRSLVNKLELDFVVDEIQDNPLIVALTINTDVPFTIIVEGTSYETASQLAILKALEYFETFAK